MVLPRKFVSNYCIFAQLAIFSNGYNCRFSLQVCDELARLSAGRPCLEVFCENHNHVGKALVQFAGKGRMLAHAQKKVGCVNCGIIG